MFRCVFTVLSLSIAVLLFSVAGTLKADDKGADSASEKPKNTVALTVDYGDGVRKEITVAWKAEMTVLDALQAAAKHPRGIKFKHRGSGATAFVTSIDGLENEGSGRNWLYTINGKKIPRSCGLQTLEAGDAVLWRFAE